LVRRISIEIMAEILNLCQKPQCKTRILYKTNLSYDMLLKYLEKLQALSMLEVHHSKTTYLTTEKGFRFLDAWMGLREHLVSNEQVGLSIVGHVSSKKPASALPSLAAFR
jgi:predicted transcriptional regulator